MTFPARRGFPMSANSRLFLIAAILAACVLPANASVTVFTVDDAGNFVPDSSVGSPAFQAAIGSPDVFLSFATDKFGNPQVNGLVAGNIYSDDVLFSTLPSTSGPGGPAVRFGTTLPGDEEIGPGDGFFAGILNIDFL